MEGQAEDTLRVLRMVKSCSHSAAETSGQELGENLILVSLNYYHPLRKI